MQVKRAMEVVVAGVAGVASVVVMMGSLAGWAGAAAPEAGVAAGVGTEPGTPAVPAERGMAAPSVDPRLLPTEPLRAPPGGIRTFSPGHARFPVRVNEEEVRFPVQAVSVVAGEPLVVDAPPEVQLLEAQGVVAPVSPGRWRWTAPSVSGDFVALRLEGPQEM